MEPNLSLKSHWSSPGAGQLDVLVELANSLPVDRIPIDLVLCIDTSGSMGSRDTAADPDRLELVAHACKVVVGMLSSLDRCAVVNFDSGSTLAQPLTAMTAENRAKFVETIGGLTPDGSTYMWEAMEFCIRHLHEATTAAAAAAATTTDPTATTGAVGTVVHNDKGDATLLIPRIPHLFVLTDGQPTSQAPGGSYGGALTSLLTSLDFPTPPRVHTFGFGKSLGTSILTDIATTGGGLFGFIPDASCVGSVFVNAVSSMLTTLSTSATLYSSLDKKVVGDGWTLATPPAGGSVREDEYGTALSISALRLGQTRRFLFRYHHASVVPVAAAVAGEANAASPTAADTTTDAAAAVPAPPAATVPPPPTIPADAVVGELNVALPMAAAGDDSKIIRASEPITASDSMQDEYTAQLARAAALAVFSGVQSATPNLPEPLRNALTTVQRNVRTLVDDYKRRLAAAGGDAGRAAESYGEGWGGRKYGQGDGSVAVAYGDLSRDVDGALERTAAATGAARAADAPPADTISTMAPPADIDWYPYVDGEAAGAVCPLLRAGSMLRDLTTEVTLATQQAAWSAWGDKYLPSLLFGYAMEHCVNFKDRGVQAFGFDAFAKARAAGEAIFLALPLVLRPVQSYGGGYGGPALTARAQTMCSAAYYDASGGCIHADSEIVADTQSGARVTVRAKDVLRGTRLVTADGVVCVVVGVLRTRLQRGSVFYTVGGKLRITGYHPIRTEAGWAFPRSLPDSAPSPALPDGREADSSAESYMYTFVCVDAVTGAATSSVVADGVPVATLGHGVEGDAVLSHAFLGTSAVVAALSRFSGWADARGVVSVTREAFVRATDGQVCGLDTRYEVGRADTERASEGKVDPVRATAVAVC